MKEKLQVKIHTKRTLTGYDIFYKKKHSGTLDNRDNVVSVRAIVSLQCHRSLGPARLCTRHDLRNFMDVSEDAKLKGNPSKETLSEDSKNLHKIVENSCKPLRLMSNGTVATDEGKRGEETYNFGLELRSIYPKKGRDSNHGIGEKFGETTLNINHTLEKMFAAKSEFRLF
ncbi:uncharacterized protein [Venturia canescens]|uniref:uncharacterized protein n=1 Tax=Venturia canescens TaxID=32260 RepID=UPI001C9CC7D7|nr:uncharacterized protein LOC122411188 [Venturia canescens]